jgi:hypothetical protein
MSDQPKNLQVFVDGEAMPAEEARAFWGRFSAYMEEHKGDLGGFAKAEGFASVHPDMGPGGAILRVSRTAAQGAYVNVSKGASESTKPAEKQAEKPAPKPMAPKLGNPFAAGGGRSFGGGGRPGGGGKGGGGGGFGPPKRTKAGGNRGR